MRKKYSNPLMYPSILLSSSGDIGPHQSGEPTPDDPWEDAGMGSAVDGTASLNSMPAKRTAEPLTIVSPVEEAITSSDNEESSSDATPESSPLEVGSVIETIVPEEDPLTTETGE